jgi:hypothetical protein
VRAAHGLGCAPGLQATVFVALARELARLWRAKIDLSAWLWGNARNPRFFPAKLVTAWVSHPILQGKPNASYMCARVNLHTHDRQKSVIPLQ